MSSWKLIDQDTGAELSIGDERTTFRNEAVRIDGLQPPDQPGAMGLVYVRFGDGSRSSGLFPGVIDAEFIETTGARAAIEHYVLNAPLFDAVFTIISFNTFHSQFGPFPHPRSVDPRMILKHRFSEHEINDACCRAGALLQEAQRANNDFLSKQLTHAEQVNGLRERYPGFSDKCYDETIRQWWFINR
jgi:hypothetical protein